MESRNLPPLLQFQDGSPVNSADDWNQRRDILAELTDTNEKAWGTKS
ncbi:MAG: hypothetical protein PHG58_09460 [Clostridia bacterium]|nr:hypothetical protein [Clostridia bacterium]